MGQPGCRRNRVRASLWLPPVPRDSEVASPGRISQPRRSGPYPRFTVQAERKHGTCHGVGYDRANSGQRIATRGPGGDDECLRRREGVVCDERAAEFVFSIQ